MKINTLPDKEYKIMTLKSCQLLQENTDKQLNEVSKTKHESNLNVNKEIEIILKDLNRNSGGEDYK